MADWRTLVNSVENDPYWTSARFRTIQTDPKDLGHSPQQASAAVD
jgi:hypothetical protein